MFNNIGPKCKAAAKALCYIGIALSVISGVIMVFAGAFSYSGSAGTLMAVYGFLTMIFGSLVSWLGSLGLYAAGEAAENSAIAANLAVKADMQREQEKQG